MYDRFGVIDSIMTRDRGAKVSTDDITIDLRNIEQMVNQCLFAE